MLVLAVLVAFPSCGQEQTEAAGQTDEIPEVEWRGRVVCLSEEMQRQHGVRLPSEHEHVYGFKTHDGKLHTLLRTKFSEALFVEPALQETLLIFKGRVFPETQIIEVTGGMRSIRNGQAHDVHYYCAICEIFSVAPGLCECCQEPSEFVEKPLSEGDDHGVIEGVVIWKGAIPKSRTPDDSGFYHDLLSVDGPTGGLQYVVAWLEGQGGAGAANARPAAPDAPVVVDQIDSMFVPRVIALQAGQMVTFTNSDAMNHNVRAASSERGNEFNIYTGVGGKYEHRFQPQPGDLPVRLGCDIHPWMRGWIYVFEQPHFAVSDARGKFVLRGVPAGEHKLILVQPDVNRREERSITVAAGETNRIEMMMK